MSPLEDRYVTLHRGLHALAKRAAEAKEELIRSYLAASYPGLRYTLSIVDRNILAVDLVFPDLGEGQSQYIIDDVMAYLNALM